jgi:hypothetical protein
MAEMIRDEDERRRFRLAQEFLDPGMRESSNRRQFEG